VQRKVFRIEQMLGKPRTLHATPSKTVPVQELHANTYADELAAIRNAISNSERELAALRSGAQLSRMQKELTASITGMDEATQKILRSTEAIDESARALSASLTDDYKRGLAQEVLEQAVQIFEACNFQDLAGQRINKAIAALQLVEQQVGRLYKIWGAVEQAPAPRKLVNGPKLVEDSGHADQSEIDRMFA
jgi:chemotaxis protein CheZ